MKRWKLFLITLEVPMQKLFFFLFFFLPIRWDVTQSLTRIFCPDNIILKSHAFLTIDARCQPRMTLKSQKLNTKVLADRLRVH